MIRLFYISAPSDSPRFYQTSIETDSLATAEAFLRIYEGAVDARQIFARLNDVHVHRFETCAEGGYPILGIERLLPELLKDDSE